MKKRYLTSKHLFSRIVKSIVLVKSLIVLLSSQVYSQEIFRKELSEIQKVQFYSDRSIDSAHYKLSSVSESEHRFHFRYSTPWQILDLKSMDGSSYTGELLNVAKELTDVKQIDGLSRVEVALVFQRISIDSETAKLVAEEIRKSRQFSLPPTPKALSWNTSFLHCETPIFQLKIDTRYKRQEYPCLFKQEDTIWSANVIRSNIEMINETIGLDLYYESFKKSLPGGIFYAKDDMRTFYVPNRRQYRRQEKYADHFTRMEQINDSLNNYLQSELNDQFAKADLTSCYGELLLHFSKSGKLKKIKSIDMPSDPDANQCIRNLKNLMESISLSFVQADLSFVRRISFWGEDQVIVQNL